MTKQMTINLPNTVYSDLVAKANARGQQVATVAAIAVELQLKDWKGGGVVAKGKVCRDDLSKMTRDTAKGRKCSTKGSQES